MSFSSEPNREGESRPWWAGSRPAWRSPWSFDDEEEVPLVKGKEIGGLEPVVGKKIVERKRVPEVEVERAELPKVGKEEWVVVPLAKLREVEAPGVEVQRVAVGRQVEVIREGAVPVPEVGAEDEENEDEDEDEGTRDLGWNEEEIRNQHRRRVKRKSRVGRRVGTSWTSLVLMAMAVLSLTFLAWLYVTDAGEVEDKDLMIAVAPDLAPTVTAPGRLATFLGSVTAVPKSELVGKPAWEWDTASMVNWLVENSQALDNLKDLLEDFDWHGRHASWHFADLGSHQNWVSAMILKQVEAAYLQRDGKHEAALSAALDLAELGRRLQDIHAWPSFYFRSLETHRRCTDTLAELLQRTMASEDALKAFQQQFEACEPMDEQVKRNVLPGFYLFEKKRLLGMQSGEPVDTMPAGVQRAMPKQLFFKTNETLGIISNTIRYLARQVGQTSAGATGMREVWEGVTGGREVGAYQPNGRGVAYARRELEPYLEVPARQQLSRTRHLLLVELFAMRRFIVREKGLPQSLEVLTPNYLKERLTDPFSGEGFRYDAVRGIIYSVGSDLEDEGGRVHLGPLADPGEPTVKIGVQKASQSQ